MERYNVATVKYIYKHSITKLFLFTGWKWLSYYLTTMCLPYIQSFYLAIGALYLFIPIMGRAGSSINSEVVMASMLSVLFCLLLSFTVYNICVLKKEILPEDSKNVIP